MSFSVEAAKDISGIEFLLSCLSPDHEYFELRMGRLHTVLQMVVEDGSIHIGSDTYDFVHRCSVLCMVAGIAEPFGESFDEQWYEMKLVPEISVPLTPFGILVATYLLENASRYVTSSSFAHHRFRDEYETALSIERACRSESDRLDRKDTLVDSPR